LPTQIQTLFELWWTLTGQDLFNTVTVRSIEPSCMSVCSCALASHHIFKHPIIVRVIANGRARLGCGWKENEKLSGPSGPEISADGYCAVRAQSLTDQL
jgi:hypothetical protein